MDPFAVFYFVFVKSSWRKIQCNYCKYNSSGNWKRNINYENDDDVVKYSIFVKSSQSKKYSVIIANTIPLKIEREIFIIIMMIINNWLWIDDYEDGDNI